MINFQFRNKQDIAFLVKCDGSINHDRFIVQQIVEVDNSENNLIGNIMPIGDIITKQKFIDIATTLGCELSINTYMVNQQHTRFVLLQPAAPTEALAITGVDADFISVMCPTRTGKVQLYQIDISDVEDFSSIVETQQISSDFQFENLNAATTYYLRMREIWVDGSVSLYGETISQLTN